MIHPHAHTMTGRTLALFLAIAFGLTWDGALTEVLAPPAVQGQPGLATATEAIR